MPDQSVMILVNGDGPTLRRFMLQWQEYMTMDSIDFVTMADHDTETGEIPFRTADLRWQAVLDRAPAADGHFWLGVATTGVYCYPSCPSRTPKRKNVSFYDTRDAAEAAGFRVCKRCRPDLPPRRERQAAAIARVCRMIDEAETVPRLADLAQAIGLSPFYFQKLFKQIVGVTPKAYAAERRANRIRTTLQEAGTVTDAIYDAGYGSASRFYEGDGATLGMSPRQFAAGAPGEVIRWQIGETWLGRVLVAATARGVCALLFETDETPLHAELQRQFPNARLEEADAGSPYEEWVTGTLAALDNPSAEPALPLDIRGTAFQRRVWDALRQIPAGTTATYAQVADRIGSPKGARAVARACATNAVAVLIPCHRVIRGSGELAGYRWGVERKQALLDREKMASQ